LGDKSAKGTRAIANLKRSAILLVRL
jgi:hypothetical protein